MLAATNQGLQVGQLVDIGTEDPSYGGQQGQLLEWMPSVGHCEVALLGSGQTVQVPPNHVHSAATFPQGPGYGGGPNGYDLILGPRTNRDVLGEAITTCLIERGFCVIRVIQSAADVEETCKALQEGDYQGKFGRLAVEMEQGMLGRSSRAKAMWVDPANPAFSSESLLRRTDNTINSLAELLQPYAEDCLGVPISERSPALACISMTESEEATYRHSEVSSKTIEDFYGTWSRTVLRVVHFFGPAPGKAVLSLKEGGPIEGLELKYEVAAAPNTLLLVRQDTFDYSFEEPAAGGRACWLQSFFLRPQPSWNWAAVEGDVSLLGVAESQGPPPPKEGLVAVVAISIQACGRMTDHHKEWAAYAAGADGQLEMPFSRFDYHPYYSEEMDMPMGTTFVKHFSVQEGIEMFDNRIFEISNMEAECMDPQCRQVMEVGYLSIHQIGFTKKYSNTNPTHASVSVGCDKQEWLSMPQAPRSVAANNQLAITANRFNYVFNLKGGSYVCDTACSSSLVAAHLGKVNLLERRWDPLEWHLGMGVGLTLTVFSFIHSCAAHMLSPGGRCFTFNATANGYNRGDGTAAMLLKCGTNDDYRMCYFRGSQIGQDGRSASMSAPNGPAQEKCVWGALREAQMSPPESTVWECHGTGTSLGDPIEVGAVRKVQVKMRRSEPLMIASSKSNFGHLEGSAAALAMNKCVLVVMYALAAPTLHLKTLNPHLDHAAFEAFFTTESNPYKYRTGHCQVSSFGVGGTNGHAIFWGECVGVEPVGEKKALVRKALANMSTVTTRGPDPAKWDYTGMDYDAGPGDSYRVVIEKDPDSGANLVYYEKQLDAFDPFDFYSVSGNFNNWGEERMQDGDVPGLHYLDVEVPESGTLEFRILAEGDPEQCIGPVETTSRRTAPIRGPSSELHTSWMVRAAAGVHMRIEFLVPRKACFGERSITWLQLVMD